MSEDLVANFELSEGQQLDAVFMINATPEKVSQLENDLDFQTETQVNEAIQAESDVINARIDTEVETLNNRIDDIEQDISDLAQVVDDNYNTLNSAIESEATTRADNDNTLQGNINTVAGDLSLEISNRTSADEVLQDNIDTVSGNLATEISDRQDTDATLQGNINTVANDLSIEETARINADTTLQGNIDTLSGTVTSNYNTLDGKITDEATARGNADTTLQNNINTLSGTVTSNYNTLSGAISDETSARQSADTTLQNNITAEATARGNADDVLDGKIGDNKTAIDNHIADKTNPHDVTKSQIGLGNVDNTSDLNKPISTATQNALNTKVSNTREINGYALSSNITLTASDVGALPDTTTINNLTTAEQQSALNSGANTTNIGQIATNTQNISNEVTNRQNADNALQSQIDALVVSSDVFDVVGTYADLQAYDISTVPVNDIIKVLVDSTHDNAATYYRCVENNNVKSWSYIGAEGAYYTKSEADSKFVEQTTTVNGQALSGNITLTASDVGALPDSTTIGNGTLTIQKNGSTIDSFGANDTGNTTVNITVPTDTGDLTNNAGYIKGINSTDVTTALGYTPYDSSNPSGYTTNTGTVTSVNNVSPVNGNVTLSIPAAVTVDSALSSTSTNPVQNKVITNALPDTNQLSYYGTCSTAAATQAKVVVCEGFTLKEGVSIRVKFTNAQTYNGMPSLNVNSTGGINVKSNGTVNAARYCWVAGEVVSFTYDGANWIMEDAGIATTSYYGYTKLYTGAGSTSTSTALTPASLNNLVQLMVEPYPIYSGSATYEVGDRARYGYQAWECITAITTAETWDADHWKEIDPIQTQIDGINAMIGDIETALNTINSGSST